MSIRAYLSILMLLAYILLSIYALVTLSKEPIGEVSTCYQVSCHNEMGTLLEVPCPEN